MGQTAIAQALLEECLRDEPNHIQAKQLLAVVKQKIPDRPEGSSPGSNLLEKVEDGPNQNGTLAFSIRAYLFIEAIALLYITLTVGFKPLLYLTSADHQPLSMGAFYLLDVAVFFGIGALVCEFILLGVAFNEDLWTGNVLTFDFINRTMQINDNPMVTGEDRAFSDYNRLARGNLDGLGLQITALFHALIKIILLPLHLVYLNRVLILVFITLPFLANMINKQPLPVLWEAGYLFILNFICYRAFLIQTARRRGVGKTREIIGKRQVALDPSLEARLQSAPNPGPDP